MNENRFEKKKSSPISRRTFLNIAGGLTAAGVIGVLSAKPLWNRKESKKWGKKQWVLSGHREAGAHDFLALEDLQQRITKRYPAPSEGHSILSHPLRPGEAIVLPKRAPRAYRIGLMDGRSAEIFDSSPGTLFYGHGVYLHDGRHFLASEDGKGGGKIIVRDARDLKIVGEIPSYGEGPHDLTLIDEGQTLVVANGEGASSIAFIDLKSGKLLERIDTPDPKVSLRHIAFGPDDAFAVATQSLDLFGNAAAPLLFGRRGGRLTEPVIPPEIRLACRVQLLSLLFHPSSGTLAATCPATHTVSLWDFKSRQWLKNFHLTECSGLALLSGSDSSKNVFIAYPARETEGLQIDPWTLDSKPIPYAGLTGSHLAVIGL